MGWTIIAVAFITWFVLVLFFTPRIDYKVTQPIRPDGGEQVAGKLIQSWGTDRGHLFLRPTISRVLKSRSPLLPVDQ